jgi:hypothetical protein
LNESAAIKIELKNYEKITNNEELDLCFSGWYRRAAMANLYRAIEHF